MNQTFAALKYLAEGLAETKNRKGVTCAAAAADLHEVMVDWQSGPGEDFRFRILRLSGQNT